jgi:hypothetical protein
MMKTRKSLTLKSILVGLCFFASLMFETSSLNAQQAVSFDEHLASLSETARVHLSELAFNVQTTAYVASSAINVVGTGDALLLEVNAADFSSINFTDASLAHVELMRIRVNSSEELSQSISFSGASSLSNLSCVVILSSVEATGNQIDSMVQDVPANVSKCYSISISN